MQDLSEELTRVFLKGIKHSPDSPLVHALMGIDEEKAPKHSADYRPSEDSEESCAHCRHFDGEDRCNIVEGEIHPDDTCDWFDSREVTHDVAD